MADCERIRTTECRGALWFMFAALVGLCMDVRNHGQAVCGPIGGFQCLT